MRSLWNIAEFARSETMGARLARAAMQTSASQILVATLAFVTSIALARLLGATGRGELALFVNAAALAVLFLGLGLSSAITYFVASGVAEPRALLRSLALIFAVTVVVAAGCVLIVAGSALDWMLPQAPSVMWPVVGLSAFFALSQAGSWLASVHVAFGSFTPLNVAAVIVAAATAAIAVGLLWLQVPWAGVWAVIGLLVLLEGLRTAILAVFPLRDRRVGPTDSVESGQRASRPVNFRAMWRYSGLTYLADGLQFFTYRFDQWIVALFFGPAELGVYALAVSLAQLVWIVPTAIARVTFPYTAMTDRRTAHKYAWRSAWVGLCVSLVLAIIGWVLSELFVTDLFGQEFAAVPELLGILLVGVVPYSMARVIGNFLAGTNALGVGVSANAAILLLTIVLDLLLIPEMAATGAAIATSITYVAYTALLLVAFMRRREPEPGESLAD